MLDRHSHPFRGLLETARRRGAGPAVARVQRWRGFSGGAGSAVARVQRWRGSGSAGSLKVMRVLVWLAEGTWPATVDAVREWAGPAAEVTLLHVIDPGSAGSAHGALAGLMGRGGRRPDPGAEIEAAEASAESRLLAAAAQRLDRPARVVSRRGRLEREVVSACAEADLLILARDGDLHRVGPRSLGPATRFVLDHAPCGVLLLWPEPPAVTQPPPPPSGRP